MKRHSNYVLIMSMAVALLSSGLSGQEKIALVLSGGGAQGLAHIGVLKAFEELGIPIDLIVGTSAGALAGGLYSAGMTPDEMAELSENGSIFNLFLGRNHEHDTPIWSADAGSRGKFSIHREPGSITGPSGILDDRMMRRELFLWTTGADLVSGGDFDSLLIPFRAVAADLNHREALLLDSGPLGEALRISMSLPLFYAPVEHSGSLLADGGLLNNLPVDLAEKAGADHIIAVSVTDPLPESAVPVDIFEYFSVLSASIFSGSDSTSVRGWDHFIRIDTRGATMFDFAAGNRLIAEGYRAGLEEGKKIRDSLTRTLDRSALEARRKTIRKGLEGLDIREVLIISDSDSSLITKADFPEGGFPSTEDGLRKWFNVLNAAGSFRSAFPRLSEDRRTLMIYTEPAASVSMTPEFEFSSVSGLSAKGFWIHRGGSSRSSRINAELGNTRALIMYSSAPTVKIFPDGGGGEKGFPEFTAKFSYDHLSPFGEAFEIRDYTLSADAGYSLIRNWDTQVQARAGLSSFFRENISDLYPLLQEGRNFVYAELIFRKRIFFGRAEEQSIRIEQTVTGGRGSGYDYAAAGTVLETDLSFNRFKTNLHVEALYATEAELPPAVSGYTTVPEAFRRTFGLRDIGGAKLNGQFTVSHSILRDDLYLSISTSAQRSTNLADGTAGYRTMHGYDLFITYESIVGPIETGISILDDLGTFRSSSWTGISIFI